MFDTDTVKKRLKSFGYEVKADDEFALTFCVEKVRSTIKNEINWNDVPEGLEHIAVDMAVGEFLLSKKTFAPDDLTGFDLEYAVKQIQTGDTNTVFATGEGSMTPEQRLTSFINYLLSYGGVIDGIRYMNEEYLKEATKKQASNSHGGGFAGGMYGYGYQIWKTPNNGFAFCGMGDQFVLCEPDKDFIFVINSDNQGMGDFSQGIIYNELYRTIIDELGESLDEDEVAFGELKDYISNLKLFSLKENTYSPVVNHINGKTFVLDKNPMEIEWIRLDFDNDKGVLSYKNAQGKKSFVFGIGHNEFGKFPQTGYSDMVAGANEPGHMYDCAVSADWPEESKLRIKVQIIDKYFGNMSIEFGFKGDEVGICMVKSAEAFLDEYQGYANGKMI